MRNSVFVIRLIRLRACWFIICFNSDSVVVNVIMPATASLWVLIAANEGVAVVVTIDVDSDCGCCRGRSRGRGYFALALHCCCPGCYND